MIALLIVLLLMLAFLLPVTFQIDAKHDGTTAYRVLIRYLFFTRKWHSGRKSRSSSKPRHGRNLLSRLREAAHISRFVRRHIHLEALDALVLLHTGDAAGSALLSGGLQGILNTPALPRSKVHIRILPDFFRGRTIWQTRCIFHFRLGIILLTMLMLLVSRLQQKARTAYGTSHW